jgi:hypothetical protein
MQDQVIATELLVTEQLPKHAIGEQRSALNRPTEIEQSTSSNLRAQRGFVQGDR